jgi:hypothetical protein
VSGKNLTETTRLNASLGWISTGPLRNGEPKNRTFVWWLDLAGSRPAAFCR